MSTLKVEICRIEKVERHVNADRLDVVQVKDWYCIVQKDSFSIGELALYIPIDSILPEGIESTIFGKDAKVKLSKHRIRTLKLRGMVSQGLVIKPELLGICAYKDGQDFTSHLGITKYEPPEELPSIYGICNKIKRRYINSNFKKYTDIENIKNNPKVFTEDDKIHISCKLHGTSFRASWAKNEANTVWKKIKKFFGFLDEYEWIVGSRNVQLTYKNKNKYFYDSNIYTKTATQYNLKDKLQMGEALYGEIIGHGIQDGYAYGCKQGETKFFAYDLMRDGVYLDVEVFKQLCNERNIPIVPELYIGAFSQEIVAECTNGASVIAPEDQPVREGCVIKSIKEEISPYVGRKLLKSINSEYLLLKNMSDFH